MDPLDPGVAYNLGTAYAMNGDVAAAMTEFDRGLEVAAGGPLTPVLLGATWLTPLAAHDRAELERRLDVIEDEDPLGIGDAMRQFLDDADAGLAEIRRRIHDDVDETTLAKALLAHFAVYFGDPDLGLQIMRSIPLDEPYLPLMLWDPGLAATRSLPGFKNLVEDMGLVPYWREYGWGDFCRPVGNEDFACE